MKTYLLVLCFVVVVVLADESSVPVDIDTEAGSALDSIFDIIIMNLNKYIDPQPYGKNLETFFTKLRAEAKKDFSLQSITNAFDNKDNLFTLVWKLILHSVKIAYAGSPLAGAFIQKFLDRVKAMTTVSDILHLITGPYGGFVEKLRSAASQAAEETGLSPKILTEFDSFIGNLEKGLRSKFGAQV